MKMSEYFMPSAIYLRRISEATASVLFMLVVLIMLISWFCISMERRTYCRV